MAQPLESYWSAVIHILRYLGPNLISWRLKQQPLVTRSSPKAKYCTFAHTSKLLWLNFLLTELHTKYIVQTILRDHVNAAMMSIKPMLLAKTKHIEKVR